MAVGKRKAATVVNCGYHLLYYQDWHTANVPPYRDLGAGHASAPQILASYTFAHYLYCTAPETTLILAGTVGVVQAITRYQQRTNLDHRSKRRDGSLRVSVCQYTTIKI